MLSIEDRSGLGRALAIVTGGATIAIALGLPLGSVIGHALGWRATFLCVGLLAAVAAIGLSLGVAKGAGDGIRVAGVSERLKVAGQPAVLKALSLTFFWAMGAFTAYPFIAPYLHAAVGFGDDGVSVAVFLWGVSAVVGMTLGGSLNDRFGSATVIGPALALLMLAFTVQSSSRAWDQTSALRFGTETKALALPPARRGWSSAYGGTPSETAAFILRLSYQAAAEPASKAELLAAASISPWNLSR